MQVESLPSACEWPLFLSMTVPGAEEQALVALQWSSPPGHSQETLTAKRGALSRPATVASALSPIFAFLLFWSHDQSWVGSPNFSPPWILEFTNFGIS